MKNDKPLTKPHESSGIMGLWARRHKNWTRSNFFPTDFEVKKSLKERFQARINHIRERFGLPF
jgi:transposase